jgi:hypothetical protein
MAGKVFADESVELDNPCNKLISEKVKLVAASEE